MKRPDTFSGRRASQVEEELNGFIGLLRERQARRYLEIGARDGDTLHAVGLALGPGAHLVAVDLPGAAWGKESSVVSLEKAAADLRKRGLEVTTVIGDSRHGAIIRRVRALGPYDATLIDGDHTYFGVLTDWLNYGEMAPLVAFHDIVGHKERDRRHDIPVEVPRLWSVIKSQGMPTREFVASTSTMGIGVVFTKE
jgi:predicted O-methyltransferase YrrM